MSEIALAEINNFAPVKSDRCNSDRIRSDLSQLDLPESESTVFVLTHDLLRSIVIGAIEEAIGAIRQELDLLQIERANDRREIAALRAQVHSLESTEEQDVTRVCLDIAQDRQRISKLERVEPQPMQADRGEILRALLAANGGKMLLKEARQKMHLQKNQFSELLAVCDFIDMKPYHLDCRKKVIILKS